MVLDVYNQGLILEGGGMRGVYTAGVLESFMENNLYFPYVIGVSAGACHAASYLSRQSGRNRSVTLDYLHHPDYISVKNLIIKKELFGMDLIFDEIPNQLVPFDFTQFHQAPETFYIGTTDCLSGEPIYFEKGHYPSQILSIIRASSSLPFLAKAMEINNRILMDGGISDPIPIKKALQDNVTKPIIILTKARGYRKKKSYFTHVYKPFYKNYPGLLDALTNRWKKYNETLEFIEELERQNKVFVIRPSLDFGVTRSDKNRTRLENLYKQGYTDSQNSLDELLMWIKN